MAEINEAVWPNVQAFGPAGMSADIRDFEDAQLDVIIDFAGFGTTTASAIDAIRHGGRVVQIGMARESATLSMQKIILKEITLVGAANGEKSECEAVLDLIAQDKISSRIVQITFEQIPEYLDRLRNGQVDGRAVAVTPEASQAHPLHHRPVYAQASRASSLARKIGSGCRLQTISRTTKDPVKFRRAIAVMMSTQGQSMPNVTSLTQVSNDYVRDVILRSTSGSSTRWTQNGAGDAQDVQQSGA